jgi:hypothetical protein
MFDTFQPEEKEEKKQLNGLCLTRLGFCSRYVRMYYVQHIIKDNRLG